jgi:hypothetical protein
MIKASDPTVQPVVLPSDYLYHPTYEWQNEVEFDAFWLVFPTFSTFTQGLNIQQTATVPNDADFECRRIMYHCDAAAGQTTVSTVPVPNMTILITDGGSGRALMNQAAPLASICSDEGAEPRDLCWPKIFTRNSLITVSITNFDAAVVTNNIRITMAGRKIFSVGQ